MFRTHRKRWSGLCFIQVAFLLVGTKLVAGDPMINSTLEKAIATVKNEKSLDARADAAEHLACLVQGIAPETVDDKTIEDMVSLLDDPADAVRSWVAAALGQLGPRAKVAVPKLLELLPAADCDMGDLTSAAAIRPALEKMGVKPPPFDPKKCK